MAFKIQSQKIRMRLEKVGVEMPYVHSKIHSDYDSAESIADSDLEDGELRKILASPLYVHARGEYYGSSQKNPQLQETGSSVFIKERRTGEPVPDYYFLNVLTHQNWEHLFLKVIKIILLIQAFRQHLNL